MVKNRTGRSKGKTLRYCKVYSHENIALMRCVNESPCKQATGNGLPSWRGNLRKPCSQAPRYHPVYETRKKVMDNGMGATPPCSPPVCAGTPPTFFSEGMEVFLDGSSWNSSNYKECMSGALRIPKKKTTGANEKPFLHKSVLEYMRLQGDPWPWCRKEVSVSEKAMG